MADTTLIQQPQTAYVLQAGQGLQGPPGPQGPAGGTAITATAAQALGGHRAVLLLADGSADYADNTNPLHLGRFAGITNGAASAGAPTTIINAGGMTEPSWAWVPDAPVFLAANGLLTQTLPATGFVQIVGMATSATTLFVNPREPISTL